MATQENTPERIELLKKRSRCQSNLDALLQQGKNTAGVFSGGQLSGGLAALPSQIDRAQKSLEAAQAALDQYDVNHSVR